MNKDMLRDVKPVIDLLYSMLNEIEEKDAELASVRSIARKMQEQVDSLQAQVSDLKAQNHAMQLFIEDHVPEEKKKLIFKVSE